MKKVVLKYLLLGLLSIGTTGCKKEVTPNGKTVTQTIYKLDETIPIIVNVGNTEEYLLNSDDADDEKINKNLYEISLVVRDFFRTNLLNDYVITQANKVANNSVALTDIVSYVKNNHRGLSDNIDNLENLISKVDLTHKSINPEKSGEIEDYVPAIFVVNAEIADFNKLPIISSGTYVTGLEQYEEYIVAWYADENGNFNEFLINEETAMSTSHPVLIIDNADESLLKRAKEKIKYQDPTQEKNQATAWYSSHEYQINYRYEENATAKSEFCIQDFTLRIQVK
jgi:hypothetical protein